MINWIQLFKLTDSITKKQYYINKNNWRKEAIESICELYYTQYRGKKGYNHFKRINQRPGSDYNRFIESHIKPLEKYYIWEALFPNIKSTFYANALDEALHLMADTKLIDRVYAGDLITVKKIVLAIKKKRAKYLDTQ